VVGELTTGLLLGADLLVVSDVLGEAAVAVLDGAADVLATEL
jgi:hypothetical protein